MPQEVLIKNVPDSWTPGGASTCFGVIRTKFGLITIDIFDLFYILLPVLITNIQGVLLIKYREMFSREKKDRKSRNKKTPFVYQIF